MTRVQYNRASLSGTVDAAKRLGEHGYIYATAYGYTIDKSRPPGTQHYVEVFADGTTKRVAPTFVNEGSAKCTA